MPWQSEAAMTRRLESTSSTRALSLSPTRTPCTMARACASQSKWMASTPIVRAVGPAAGADAGAIGRDLRVAEQRLVLDVAGDIIVAGAQVLRFAKPFGVGDVLADGAKAVGAAVSDDVAVEVAKPEVEIDGVGTEDHAETLRGMRDGRGAGRGRAIDQRG